MHCVYFDAGFINQVILDFESTPTDYWSFESSIPNTYALSQNYPNPFNPSTNIYYSVPQYSFVTIKVYDVLGNEISTLVSEGKPAGNYIITFDGESLSSGVYLYCMKAENFIETKKLVLLK